MVIHLKKQLLTIGPMIPAITESEGQNKLQS